MANPSLAEAKGISSDDLLAGLISGKNPLDGTDLDGIEVKEVTLLASEVEIKNDSGNPIPSLEQKMPGAEDNTNNTYGFNEKPQSGTDYCYTIDTSTGLEASTISKPSGGNLFRGFGVIDAAAAADMYYVQFLDSATVPADGAVTHIIPPIPVNHNGTNDSTFDTGWLNGGIPADNGIVCVISTTLVTKTITGNIALSTVVVE